MKSRRWGQEGQGGGGVRSRRGDNEGERVALAIHMKMLEDLGTGESEPVSVKVTTCETLPLPTLLFEIYLNCFFFPILHSHSI